VLLLRRRHDIYPWNLRIVPPECCTKPGARSLSREHEEVHRGDERALGVNARFGHRALQLRAHRMHRDVMGRSNFGGASASGQCRHGSCLRWGQTPSGANLRDDLPREHAYQFRRCAFQLGGPVPKSTRWLVILTPL